MEKGIEVFLESIKEKLLHMSSLASKAVQNSVKGLLENDEKIAKSVIEEDKYINNLEVEIDSLGLEFLARYQPEASDLRFIIAVLRMNTDIERIGDYAVNISKASLYLIDKPFSATLIDISYLAEICSKMFEDSMNSLIIKDVSLAKSVIERDEKVDNICDQIFREMLTYMMENPKLISRGIQLILISRHLERVADHSTNIAESSIFAVEGKIIKHRFEEI